MSEISRSQLVVYGALAVVGLLLGARWIGSEDTAGASSGTTAHATASAAEGVTLAGGSGDVVVHVVGAVARPGVYRLPEGSRVTDAVKRAGGAAAGAELDGINLAARLADGQQVVMPEHAPSGVAPVDGPGAAVTPISLGTATIEQLDTIQGIGPVTAQQIVDFRDQHGGLSSVDQLDQISGVGPATMEALRTALQP